MKKPRLRVTRADVAWLLLAGLLVMLQFWWLPGDGGNTADSFSNTMEGSRGLFETLSVLSEKGYLPPVRRESAELIPDEPGVLLILSPDRYPDEYEQEQLRDFVQDGGTVVLAANRTAPSLFQPEVPARVLRYTLEWKQSDFAMAPVGSAPATSPAGSPDDSDESADDESSDDEPASGDAGDDESALTAESPDPDADPSDESAATPPAPASPGTTPVYGDDGEEMVETQGITDLVDSRLPWRSAATISSAPRNAENLVVDSSGDVQVATWPLGRGRLIVCASSDPFSNRSMLFPVQAEFAVRLTEYACEPVRGGLPPAEIVVSEYFNAAGSYTGTAVMVSPLLRAGTLQLILVAVLISWAGFHRFGPPLRERRSWRRSLAESAEAVGNLQFTAGDGRTSVRQYYDWFAGEVRRRDGHTRILDDTEQLARQTGLVRQQVVEALEDVRQRSQQEHVAPADAAAAIRRLARIHQRMFATSRSGSKKS